MSDLPDFYVRVVEESVEAGSFVGGADAAKSASPVSKDIYLATDTGILYVCFADGSWTNIGVLYLLLAGGTMTGNIDMGSHKITGLAAPTASTDAARKNEVDTVDAKLDDISDSQPSRAVDTTYQNTSGKILAVAINLELTNGATCIFYCGAASTPTTKIYEFANYTGSGDYKQIFYNVPPSYYYRVVEIDATVSVDKWTEQELL